MKSNRWILGFDSHFPINNLMRGGSAHFLEFRSDEKKVTLTFHLEESVPPILAEEQLVDELFTNLISNAVKFSSPESVVRIVFSDDHLVLESGENVEALRLTVSDEGIGIPEEELESVFDKFVQSSETNTGAGGTGLGLAICKQIVEHHKGRIFAENNQDAGTSFHLILPRVNVVD